MAAAEAVAAERAVDKFCADTALAQKAALAASAGGTGRWRLHVKDLNEKTTSEQIKTLFAAYGTVVEAEVKTTRGRVQRVGNEVRSRGQGFVDMSSDAEATKAAAALHGTTVDGNKIIVVRPTTEKDTRLHVKNLDEKTTRQQIETLFAKHGTVKKAEVKSEPDHFGNMSRFGANAVPTFPKPRGFVIMSSAAEAAKAAAALNGTKLDGKIIEVVAVVDKKDKGKGDAKGDAKGKAKGGDVKGKGKDKGKGKAPIPAHYGMPQPAAAHYGNPYAAAYGAAGYQHQVAYAAYLQQQAAAAYAAHDPMAGYGYPYGGMQAPAGYPYSPYGAPPMPYGYGAPQMPYALPGMPQLPCGFPGHAAPQAPAALPQAPAPPPAPAPAAVESSPPKGKGKGKGKGGKGEGKGKGKAKAPEVSNAKPPPPGSVFQGTLKSVSPKNGYGFIDCDKTYTMYERDVYVDSAQVPSGAQAGSVLRFGVELSPKGHPKAINTTMVG